MNLREGVVYVQVDATGWVAAEREFYITLGTTSRKQTCMYEKSSEMFETIVQEFEIAANGLYTVTFSTVDKKRILLDNIVISQIAPESDDEPGFAFTPSPPTSVVELDEISFAVSATVKGGYTNVFSTKTLPANASYNYDVQSNSGQFSWTPALGQAGEYTLAFGAYGADGEIYSVNVPVTVESLPLSAPGELTISDVTYNSFNLDWEPVVGAHGYIVNIWTGSCIHKLPR